MFSKYELIDTRSGCGDYTERALSVISEEGFQRIQGQSIPSFKADSSGTFIALDFENNRTSIRIANRSAEGAYFSEDCIGGVRKELEPALKDQGLLLI
jgi:hypothetical protein